MIREQSPKTILYNLFSGIYDTLNHISSEIIEVNRYEQIRILGTKLKYNYQQLVRSLLETWDFCMKTFKSEDSQQILENISVLFRLNRSSFTNTLQHSISSQMYKSYSYDLGQNLLFTDNDTTKHHAPGCSLLELDMIFLNVSIETRKFLYQKYAENCSLNKQTSIQSEIGMVTTQDNDLDIWKLRIV